MSAQVPHPDRLGACAVSDESSRGRAHVETPGAGESPFEIDRLRIIQCTAFRRLMHKTQVFVGARDDHFRTRLTHTLEVATQSARLARRLGLNERLAHAVGLAHDLGHPPFGHAGEAALAELMADHGGFEHNLQSLRVVDYLEHPYPAFRGLNLSFELRESLVKHRTRFDRPDAAELDPALRPFFAAGRQPPLEGQAANLADVIAYTLHDVEDGLGADLIDGPTLNRSELWRTAAVHVRSAHPSASLHAVRRPILDRLADILLDDAARETARRVEAAGARSVDAVRGHDKELASFSDRTDAQLSDLQSLLSAAVYRHERVARLDAAADQVIRELFSAILADPRLLPERFARRLGEQDARRVTCDYVAGMTDRYCSREHERLFGRRPIDQALDT